MQRLTFDIHATETECSEGKQRCPFMRKQRFGTVFVCSVFDQELCDADGVPSGTGRLQRLAACKAVEEAK